MEIVDQSFDQRLSPRQAGLARANALAKLAFDHRIHRFGLPTLPKETIQARLGVAMLSGAGLAGRSRRLACGGRAWRGGVGWRVFWQLHFARGGAMMMLACGGIRHSLPAGHRRAGRWWCLHKSALAPNRRFQWTASPRSARLAATKAHAVGWHLNEVHEMRIKCSIYCGASLDGFIAKPDGDIAWLQRSEYVAADSIGLTYDQFISSVDAVVMGRRTFESVLTFQDWPYGIPVIVLSTTLQSLPEHLQSRVTLKFGPPNDIVQDLANQGYRHLYIDGGNTIQRFLKARLIHEITVTYLPILLGSGISLFGSIGVEMPLQLLQTTTSSNGFVQVRYRVEHAAQ